jgi:ADP-dependent NAD(P)H-hydrate dehydratase
MCRVHHADSEPITIDDALLRGRPLPPFSPDANKDGRGSVLVIGGTRETPGGVLLAGRASLRAGAGRLCLATVESMSRGLAIEVPEARVVSLGEDDHGSIDRNATDVLLALSAEYDAVLLGPGIVDPEPITGLVRALLRAATSSTTVVLDAAALGIASSEPDEIASSHATVILIPNTKEMGTLLGCDETMVRDEPVSSLLDAVTTFRTSVALRGADTWVTAPDEALYLERDGTIALATAGSGDVFAGALAGFVARGASPLLALLWAVHVHARTGSALAQELGIGVLASDLLDALPLTLTALDAASQ